MISQRYTFIGLNAVLSSFLREDKIPTRPLHLILFSSQAAVATNTSAYRTDTLLVAIAINIPVFGNMRSSDKKPRTVSKIVI